mmetsp:Transcript_34506/g.78770  ORF Transcript_34506/g.78770 Transcript_34506/m.78770 type:complete len:751 (-) Transcript_34506:101-2353(-)
MVIGWVIVLHIVYRAAAYSTPDSPPWSRKDMLCALAGATDILTLHAAEDSAESIRFPKEQAVHWYGRSLANGSLMHGPRKTCAVISSSGVLQAHKYGTDIDGADIVIRFNDAPTKGFESNVGRKDVVRLMNNLFASQLLHNRSKVTLEEHITYVVFPISEQEIADTAKVQRMYPNIDIFSADMGLQREATIALRKLYPSSWFQLRQSGSAWMATTGAAGMLIALSVCDEVKAYGMASSTIEHKYPYHYYDRAFAFQKSHSAMLPWDWHADENFFHKTFSAEKDLWKRVSSTSSDEVDSTTISIVQGFNQLQCTQEELNLLATLHPEEGVHFRAYFGHDSVLLACLAIIVSIALLIFAAIAVASFFRIPHLLGVDSDGNKSTRWKGVLSLLMYGVSAMCLQASVRYSAAAHDGIYLWNPIFTLLLIEASKGILSIFMCCFCCCLCGTLGGSSDAEDGRVAKGLEEGDKESVVPLVSAAAPNKPEESAREATGSLPARSPFVGSHSTAGLCLEAAVRLFPAALCRVVGGYWIYALYDLCRADTQVFWRGLTTGIVGAMWIAYFGKQLQAYHWLATAGVVCGSLLGSVRMFSCHADSGLLSELEVALACIALGASSVMNEGVLKQFVAKLGVDKLNVLLFLETSLLVGAAVLFRTAWIGETIMFLSAGYDIPTVILIVAETFAGLIAARALLHSSAAALAVVGSLAQLVDFLSLMLMTWVAGLHDCAWIYASASALISTAVLVLLIGFHRYGQ